MVNTPGSTFKPIVGLAGIGIGAITWEEQSRTGDLPATRPGTRLSGLVLPRMTRRPGHGDLRRAIYRSSNVYFYDLATRMDINDLVGLASILG